jgi:hypothetical protein
MFFLRRRHIVQRDGTHDQRDEEKCHDIDPGYRAKFFQDYAFGEGKYGKTQCSCNIAKQGNYPHLSYHLNQGF